MPIDLLPLYRRLRKKSGEQDSVWPALTLTLYADQPAEETGPAMAMLVSEYLKAIPRGALKATLLRDQVGPLTPQRMRRDLHALERPTDFEMKIYSSSERGQPSDYGCFLMLKRIPPEQREASSWCHVIRLEFPWRDANADGIDVTATKLIHLADILAFSCAIGGFGFSYWASDRFAADQVRAMLPRYIGFEHSDARFTAMANKTPCPSWLTFVSHDLVKELDGNDALRNALPTDGLIEMTHGICVRAARLPPVGDVNRGAADIGMLPLIARWMKPRRFVTRGFAGSQIEIDVASWLSRFDERTNGAWANES